MINLGLWTSLELLSHSPPPPPKKIEDGNSKNSTLLGSNVKVSTSNRSSKIVQNCTLRDATFTTFSQQFTDG